MKMFTIEICTQKLVTKLCDYYCIDFISFYIHLETFERNLNFLNYSTTHNYTLTLRETLKSELTNGSS
jgi:hypothetical protein